MLTTSDTLFAPGTLLARLADRAQQRRLEQALTRRALAERSGVPESTVKRFERSGEIGSRALVRLLAALGLGDQIESLFEAPAPQSVDDLLRPVRQRGQRADAGKKRPAGAAR